MKETTLTRTDSMGNPWGKKDACRLSAGIFEVIGKYKCRPEAQNCAGYLTASALDPNMLSSEKVWIHLSIHMLTGYYPRRSSYYH